MIFLDKVGCRLLAFSISGKGYWGLGANQSGYLRDLWMYDPQADSWVQKKDFPFDLPVEASATIGTSVYIVTYSGSVYEYNPSFDEWKPRSNFPPGNRPGLTGFSLEGKAYFGTGNNVDPNNLNVYNDFWQYDPLVNEWTRIADFPGTARTEAVSFVVGNIAYVGLGFNAVAAPPIYKDIYRYNPSSNQWTQIADFPETDALVGIYFTNSTSAFIGVPQNSQTHLGQMYQYQPWSNSWKKLKVFPDGNSLYTASFLIDDRIFVLGGWWSEYSNNVWEYLP